MVCKLLYYTIRFLHSTDIYYLCTKSKTLAQELEQLKRIFVYGPCLQKGDDLIREVIFTLATIVNNNNYRDANHCWLSTMSQDCANCFYLYKVLNLALTLSVAWISVPFYRWGNGGSDSSSSCQRTSSSPPPNKFPDTWRNIQSPYIGLGHFGWTLLKAVAQVPRNMILETVLGGPRRVCTQRFILLSCGDFMALGPILSGVRQSGIKIVRTICQIRVNDLWVRFRWTCSE